MAPTMTLFERTPIPADYYRAMIPVRWHLMAAVGITMVFLAPAYFYYDNQLLAMGVLDEHLVRFLFWSHTAQVGYSLIFLGAYLLRSRFRYPVWFQVAMLRLGLFFLYSTVTIQVVLTSFVSTDPALYILAAVSGIVVFIEPPRVMALVYFLSGGTIVASSIRAAPDPFIGVFADITIPIVAIGSWLVYTIHLHMRFRVYRQQEELRELNTIKDAVLRATGHDLRSPLEQIQRLLAFLDDPEEGFLRRRHQIREELARVFNRAFLVMDNITALSDPAILAGRRRSDVVPLRELLDQVIIAMRPDLETKQIKPVITTTPEVILQGSDHMLRSILENLIGNAIKYSYPGGTIRINTDIGDRTVTVSIGDSGIGMDQKTLESLFLSDVKQSRVGTAGELGSGIGLAVCRTFLKLHGSDLDIQSTPGRGTIVGFTLKRYRR